MSILKSLPENARFPLICALLLPLLALIVTVVQAQRSEGNLAMSFRWVDHTQQVQKELQRVNLYATKAMLGGASEQNADSLRRATQAVRDLTRDNPVQQINSPQLEQRVNALLKGAEARTPASLERLDEVSARMWNEEERLLGERQSSMLKLIRSRTVFLWGLVAFIALFLGAGLLLARRLSRLERFVQVCAWTRTIEYQGEWISFETYLERRFNIHTSHGISPDEAERLMAELQVPPEFAASQAA